jgi:plasmid stabilization system protein ParE
MNPSFRVLPAVADDIFEIWRFIAEDNVEAANRVENEIWDAFAELAKFPEIRQDLICPTCEQPYTGVSCPLKHFIQLMPRRIDVVHAA